MSEKLSIELAILQGQMTISQSYILLFQSRIQSGIYKTRIRHHGINGPLFTEDELLRDEFATLEKHITNMQNIVNCMHNMQHNASSNWP